eukprot:2911771-Prymnesium_polylepis.1
MAAAGKPGSGAVRTSRMRPYSASSRHACVAHATCLSRRSRQLRRGALALSAASSGDHMRHAVCHHGPLSHPFTASQRLWQVARMANVVLTPRVLESRASTSGIESKSSGITCSAQAPVSVHACGSCSSQSRVSAHADAGGIVVEEHPRAAEGVGGATSRRLTARMQPLARWELNSPSNGSSVPTGCSRTAVLRTSFTRL